MTAPLRIRRVQVFPLAIPLRFRFEHAAGDRDTADPVILQLAAEAPYAAHVGYGETLARRYVTGETSASVVDDITETFVPHLLEFRASSFAEAVEFASELPTRIDGRLVSAARCAVELALLDLAGRVFHRRLSDVTGWMDQPGFGRPGCVEAARYSGIVVGRAQRRMTALLRLQRCYGLRDFKIKVAVQGWETHLEQAHSVLRRGLQRGALTLRADANGAWDLEQARQALPTLERFGVTALEQPLPPAQDKHLPALAEQTPCDLIADESLLTIEDAEELIEAGGVRVLNIRLAKNGGLLPALRIAGRALAAGLDVQLGCLVGETSILAAAGIAFLEACPQVRFVEGAFGRLLLRTDVTGRPLRFGRGGRVRPPAGFGLGLHVSEHALRRLATTPVHPINL
ncbi:MAG: mandelate racemase/muconate lactonizing enzyme family protein [Phycisphaerae bacterium]